MAWRIQGDTGDISGTLAVGYRDDNPRRCTMEETSGARDEENASQLRGQNWRRLQRVGNVVILRFRPFVPLQTKRMIQ